MFVLTVLLTSYLIFSLYCAFLVSFLAVKRVNWPFTNLEDLLDSNYKFVDTSCCMYPVDLSLYLMFS